MKYYNKVAACFGYALIRKSKLDQLTAENHLRLLLDCLGVTHVVDAGANRGQYALMLREIGYTGGIFSFEPVAENFIALQKKSLNDDRWHVFNYALGSSEAEAMINVTNASVFSSLYTPNQFSEQKFGKEKISVERQEQISIKRLDTVLEQLLADDKAARVFLKMDTQGHDMEVFLGSERSLGSIVGLQSELSVTNIYQGTPNYIDSLTAYRDKGFEVTGLYPISRDHQSMVIIEYDCFMRKFC